MSAMIQLPQLTGGSEQEQLRQMRGYLYQMAQQLNYALGTVETSMIQVREDSASALQRAASAGQKQSPKGTFNSIKSLIIKSADIVDAYYEEITRKLEGKYVAQSTFGTYTQETAQKIRENADGISRAFTNIQQIQSDVAEVNDQLLEVSAYIKTGLLYYGEDGQPVYGVEIGQQNTMDGVVAFQKFARLTSGKLSFYDANNAEVAYISDYRLHITTADIKELLAESAEIGRLQMGNYSWSVGTDGHYTLT